MKVESFLGGAETYLSEFFLKIDNKTQKIKEETTPRRNFWERTSLVWICS